MQVDLADVLSSWGRAHGYETQASIARALGMSQPTLSQKLKGERTWSIHDLHRLSVLLGTPMDILYHFVA